MTFMLRAPDELPGCPPRDNLLRTFDRPVPERTNKARGSPLHFRPEAS